VAARERLLDPTGDGDLAVDTTLSPRLRSVRGLTVGLLENAKPNASVLLSAVARELRRAHGVQASVMYTKSYFGTPAEESLIQRILHNCDFAVAVLVAVAGANNAGVSAVIETFGPRGGPPPVVKVAERC
jgi:hypothetical protein